VKSIPRSKIEGKEVYNPDGNLVGTVQELGVMPGEQAINLIIKTKYGGVIEVPWLDISAAGDVIILSKSVRVEPPPAAPAVAVAPAAQPVQPVQPAQPVTGPGRDVICPICGKKATYIPQYNRYYCYTDKRYV